MKPATLLLTASLIANLAFVGVLATRPAASKPTTSAVTPPSRSGSTAGSNANAEAIRAALASGDVAALEAAGVSSDIAREISLGRTFSRLAEKLRAAQTKNSADSRWWKLRPGAASGSREQQLVARRELSDALIAAFGDDLGLGSGDQSQLAFLPAGKRDALRRVIQDYDEMMAKFSGGSIQLASDREKLRLLRIERERDIAALLTPDERAAYEMRTSSSGNIVRGRYGDAIESEGEFQKIYALQKAFDEKFPRQALRGGISPEVMRTRADAEHQLDADIRAAVGDDRYAALRRSADPDSRTVDSLVQRLNLPATTTETVLASRNTYSAESQRIVNDTSLTMQQRRDQIQALATQAKSELNRTLGGEAADAYVQRSPWMSMLQNGMAYSTTPPESSPGSFFPGGGQSVYPVMPAGTMLAGAQSNFTFSAAAPIEGVAVHDAIVSGGGGNVQVMSFSTSSNLDPTGAPATDGQPVRRIINVSPQGNPGPQTASPAPQPKR